LSHYLVISRRAGFVRRFRHAGAFPGQPDVMATSAGRHLVQLRALAATPGGPWLLAGVAFGLVMFGLYSCCEARWRRV
jgi:uncharacterized protein DUF1206